MYIIWNIILYLFSCIKKIVLFLNLFDTYTILHRLCYTKDVERLVKRDVSKYPAATLHKSFLRTTLASISKKSDNRLRE